jgi:hypothetical protein
VTPSRRLELLVYLAIVIAVVTLSLQLLHLILHLGA